MLYVPEPINVVEEREGYSWVLIGEFLGSFVGPWLPKGPFSLRVQAEIASATCGNDVISNQDRLCWSLHSNCWEWYLPESSKVALDEVAILAADDSMLAELGDEWALGLVLLEDALLWGSVSTDVPEEDLVDEADWGEEVGVERVGAPNWVFMLVGVDDGGVLYVDEVD